MTWTVLRKVESRISLRFSRRETLSLGDAKGLRHGYLREFPRATEFLQGHLLRDQFCRAGIDLPALRGTQRTDEVVHIPGHPNNYGMQYIWSENH